MKNTIFSLIPALAALMALTLTASPVQASRSIEWRDGALWVIEESGEVVPFGPLSQVPEPSVWYPRVASISPDGEWVAFVRHTGGGYENEGQSCYVASWDGDNERIILRSDRTIPAVYWLEGSGRMFVAVQMVSGGTSYRSYFTVADFETGEELTEVEGMIYGISSWGSRAQPVYPGSSVGVRYEVLGQNEEPCRWGIVYVDEFLDFGPETGISFIGESSAGQLEFLPPFPAPDSQASAPILDGRTSTVWVGDEFELSFSGDENPVGFFLMGGFDYHEPPEVGDMFWTGHDWFSALGRPRQMKLTFADGAELIVRLEDSRCPQWVEFPEGAKIERVLFSVISVYGGYDSDQCAISEIFMSLQFAFP